MMTYIYTVSPSYLSPLFVIIVAVAVVVIIVAVAFTDIFWHSLQHLLFTMFFSPLLSAYRFLVCRFCYFCFCIHSICKQCSSSCIIIAFLFTYSCFYQYFQCIRKLLHSNCCDFKWEMLLFRFRCLSAIPSSFYGCAFQCVAVFIVFTFYKFFSSCL